MRSEVGRFADQVHAFSKPGVGFIYPSAPKGEKAGRREPNDTPREREQVGLEFGTGLELGNEKNNTGGGEKGKTTRATKKASYECLRNQVVMSATQ